MGVIAKGIFRVARVYSPPCPWDTHYQFSIKNSSLKNIFFLLDQRTQAVVSGLWLPTTVSVFFKLGGGLF